MIRTLILVIFFSLFLAGCENEKLQESTPKKGVLVQVSVIDALLQGIYDGFYPIGDLLKLGDFGIGTFHTLNGEMVVLNDTVFQVLASGEVNKPTMETTTPFASVVSFYTDTTFKMHEIVFDSLKAQFYQFFPTPNLFYAIKLSGTFRHMKTRSVPEQVKPYKPLVEVTVNQPEFEFEDVHGDVVGFYCPDFAKGINVAGLHLHFLNSSRTGGGHILNFEMIDGTMQVDYLFDFRLILPEGGDFYGGNFTIDRSEDLENVEK